MLGTGVKFLVRGGRKVTSEKKTEIKKSTEKRDLTSGLEGVVFLSP